MVMPLEDEKSIPPTEVSSKARRRTFTAEYKLRIIQEVDACKGSGQIGALLRREGLYSSQLTDWRHARDRGELADPSRKRGPKPAPKDPSADKVALLEKQLARMTARAEHAEALVELQKKVAALLGKPLPEPSEKP